MNLDWGHKMGFSLGLFLTHSVSSRLHRL